MCFFGREWNHFEGEVNIELIFLFYNSPLWELIVPRGNNKGEGEIELVTLMIGFQSLGQSWTVYPNPQLKFNFMG